MIASNTRRFQGILVGEISAPSRRFATPTGLPPSAASSKLARENHLMISPVSLPEQLCLACGLCCNGVLFKDVELQPGDDAERLRALGLPVRNARKAGPTFRSKPEEHDSKFRQPCAALCADNRCRIYAKRPARCRQFECALFKSVAAGETELVAALKTVRATLQRAARVRRLLRILGDIDEHLPLSLRFKRTRRRLETGGFNDASADAFGELTLAVQALNVVLSERFYPGNLA
jgi:Fe-S-cluster containining protein